MEYWAELLFYLAPFLGLLAVGSLISDFILPHIGPLARWIDTLPMMQEEDQDGED